ncbi:MAG: hypothetical protein ABJH05_10125 [Fulvivirga sp.]
MRLTSVLLLIIFFCSGNIFGQETKRKRKLKGKQLEHYYVLKKNKKVKHGQYLRFQLDILDNKTLIESGSFNHGKKSGKWYLLDHVGALKHEGSYQNGLKQGLWIYYYKPDYTDQELFNSHFNSQEGRVIVGENGKITIIKEGLKISSTGVYHQGNKIGIWNYYSSDSLIHKYDHTLNKLKYSLLPDSLNTKFPYLGGLERFATNFITILNEKKVNGPQSSSLVKYKLNVDNNKFEKFLLESSGDINLITYVNTILDQIQHDWMKPTSSYQITLIVEYKVEVDGSKYSIRFR